LASILILGSIGYGVIAFADDDDDPCLENEIDDDDSIRLGIHSTIAHVLGNDDDDDDFDDDDFDDDERDDDDEPCPPTDPPPGGDPSIDPTSGGFGATFTITDPQGRIQAGDIAVFYPEGGAPEAGSVADNISVSADGTTLTGNVPQDAPVGVDAFVSVRGSLTEASRFNDLPFSVTV